MKKRLTSILVALSMMVGVMPVIGQAETEKAIDDSVMIESEIITDSDNYVDDYSYEQEIIDEELMFPCNDLKRTRRLCRYEIRVCRVASHVLLPVLTQRQSAQSRYGWKRRIQQSSLSINP